MLRSTRFIVVALLGVSALAGAEPFEDGTYLVGQDIQPGAYEAPGGKVCVWFLHRGGDQYVTSLTTDRDAVEILEADLAFHTEGVRHLAVGGRPNGNGRFTGPPLSWCSRCWHLQSLNW